MHDHPDLRQVAQKFQEKLQKIRLFLTDVDGVLTTGQLFWASEEVGWNRFFNSLDGYGLKCLSKAGLEVGIISGGGSLGLRNRCQNLKIKHFSLGNEDKREGYLKIKNEVGVEDDQILYIGDEFFDLPLLKRAGFSATTAFASHEIQEAVDYVTYRPPGMGCVREVVDIVRYAQNIVPKIPTF